MGFRRSAEEAGWRLRAVGEEAGWTVREAAWVVEEHLLWPGSDAARAALRRALEAIGPLQSLIQTRIAWPLADRLRGYGATGRATIAALAVTAAAGAAIGGAQLGASDGGPSPEPSAVASSPSLAVPTGDTLSGLAPDFEQTASQTQPPTPAATPAPPAGPKAAPDQVAWRFAQAFVTYEVGNGDEATAAVFSEVAEEPLAEALGTDPPRLPESAEVPQAKVLNVVLGKRRGSELEASVSLLRLKAASELRLTLRRDKGSWRVAEVRG